MLEQPLPESLNSWAEDFSSRRFPCTADEERLTSIGSGRKDFRINRGAKIMRVDRRLADEFSSGAEMTENPTCKTSPFGPFTSRAVWLFSSTRIVLVNSFSEPVGFSFIPFIFVETHRVSFGLFSRNPNNIYKLLDDKNLGNFDNLRNSGAPTVLFPLHQSKNRPAIYGVENRSDWEGKYRCPH